MTVRPAYPVQISRTFAASPEALFNAWIDPEVASRWLFASRNRQTLVVSGQRVGTRFSILEWNEDRTLDHFGEFLEIEAPARLAFTLEVPERFPGMTHVTVEIAPYADGSAMTFTQVGVKKELTEEDWRQMFERLAEVLAERPAC